MRPHSTRRSFLASSGSASSLALYPGLLAARAARKLDEPPQTLPSETITLGAIGVGGMGRGLVEIFRKMPDVRIAAVADVFDEHANLVKGRLDGKCDIYRDFRKILDRNDIDAVLIATPDHWHAIPAMLACQAGKDVYCEKPLSNRLAESQAIAAAAAKYHRVTQMGNLIHSGENYRRVVEIVRSGVLGRISKTRVWLAASVPQRYLGNPRDTHPPEGCDYNFWLGPAPDRPFNRNRFTFNWRYFWDYGGGMLTDFCCHIVDLVHWAMEVDAPKTITASGGRYALQDNGETPDTLEVIYEYETREGHPFLMVWSHTDASGHGLENRGLGIAFQGTEGTLVASYNDYEYIPEKKGATLPDIPRSIPRSPGHHREWLDAIKSRGETTCHFAYGHRLTSVGCLGNIALWTGQKLHWDAQAEQITNIAAANAHLSRPDYRAPWTLPAI